MSMILSSRTTAGRVSFRTGRVAFRVHIGRSLEPGTLQGTPDGICLEPDFEDSQMNRFLQDVLCAAVLGACATLRTQAEDTSSAGQFQSLTAPNGAPATMSVKSEAMPWLCVAS